VSFPAAKRRYTVAKYLAFEEPAADHHELWNGKTLAISGETHRHGQSTPSLQVALGIRLQGKPGRPMDSNICIRTATGRYAYSGASIIC
jgi:hypothetical protein